MPHAKIQRRRIAESKVDSNSVFKIQFFNCGDCEKIHEARLALEKCDALIQDFRMNYVSNFNPEESAEYWFSVQTCFDIFVEKLRKTKLWSNTNYSRILTTDISESCHIPLGFSHCPIK